MRITPAGVHITGTLSKSTGTFKIDHPLDPANKYLYHSFVESPEMLNIYNRKVELDHTGSALVRMPEWFDSLNTDIRYQLTAAGAPAPGPHVDREFDGESFGMGGGPPGGTVSWQITGVRNDPYARATRVKVEEQKPLAEQGTFLFPEYYDAGEPTLASTPNDSNRVIAAKNTQIRALRAENEALRSQVTQILNRLSSVESVLAASPQTVASQK